MNRPPKRGARSPKGSSPGAKRGPSGPKPRPSDGGAGPKGRPAGPPPARARLSPARPPQGGPPRQNILYGRNPVAEALRAGKRRVRGVYVSRGAAREFPKAKVVSAEELLDLAGTDAHQGVVAKVDAYPYADADALLRLDAPLVVALDEVQDPQNLGAIARTAEAAGAAGMVVPERRSAEVTAAAAKASAGAVEHLPIARVRNLADYLSDAKAAGFWCYGADESARTRYDQADWQGGVVLVLGAEGKGLRPRVRAHCDLLVSLPLHGRIGSLNVSAAAAILLYEAVSKRGS